MADEVKFVAIATEPCIGVPVVAGDALHLGLSHGTVVVILTV